MHHYTPHSFSLPEIAGISQPQIDAHLKLYQGYVTHVNVITEKVDALIADGREKNTYVISELWRRLGFEFNGMRSHEYYFGALAEGAIAFDPESSVGKALTKQYGSLDAWQAVMTSVGMTRGSGWCMCYWDAVVSEFIIGWIDEHHIGYLSSLPIIVALDCWEHAYMVDAPPSGRSAYIGAYLNALNWNTVNKWFEEAQK